MLYYQNYQSQLMNFMDKEAVDSLFVNKCVYLDRLLKFYNDYVEVNLIGKMQMH